MQITKKPSFTSCTTCMNQQSDIKAPQQETITATALGTPSARIRARNTQGDGHKGCVPTQLSPGVWETAVPPEQSQQCSWKRLDQQSSPLCSRPGLLLQLKQIQSLNEQCCHSQSRQHNGELLKLSTGNRYKEQFSSPGRQLEPFNLESLGNTPKH